MKTLAQKARLAKPAFALVVTLLLMVLLSLISVGLLSLSSISLRTSAQGQAQAIAKANARFALMLAIGQLQSAAGPDRVVTGPALLANRPPAEVANPGWSGVWSSVDLTAKPIWLVSGEQPDPAKSLTDADSTILAKSVPKPGTAAAAAADLRASWVKVANPASRGRYAYWIGDEGTKARVDLARVATAAPTERERLVRCQSPQEPGISQIDPAVWGDFGTAGVINKKGLISMGTVALAARESGAITHDSLPQYYFNDLSTGGFGLPVNVKDGGMKADLSLLFDSTQLSKTSMIRNYLGGVPALLPGSDRLSANGAKVYGFSIDSDAAGRKKFYLSDQISKDGTVGVGPNWGILWNYGHLWENVTNQQAPLVGVTPRVESSLQDENWLPYSMNGSVENQRDHQHLNSSLAPVLSTFQMGFRLSATPGPASSTGGKQYYAQLEIKPVVGLWNPYNVAIKPQRYKFEWAVYPFLRFDYQKSDVPLASSNANVITTFMRERWAAGTAPTSANPQGNSWLRLLTEPVDFQPGEFRMFSIETTANIAETNKLISGWGENGAFVIDLLRADGSKVLVPAGYSGWFGTVDLQDTHQADTFTKFPGLKAAASAATTWITVNAVSNTSNGANDSINDIHLTRLTNLWNGGSSTAMGRPFMPEQIISARHGNTTGKTMHRIEDLANKDPGLRNVAHIGTWSFFSRTSTQLLDAEQGLRGWIDTNPRTLVGLPKFDGSSAEPNRSGWNTVSPFIGGSHDPAPREQVGDGDGGNRGLIAEGGAGEPEPQAIAAGGRYQGFGGNSNTATGQTHVVVYDVPRAPLHSLGQFQSAELGRYNFEPGFVAGNSYANPRIPLNQIVAKNFAGIKVGSASFDLVDVSFDVNRKLWDPYFFSTLGADYLGGIGTSLDAAVDIRKLASGEKSLPNPRMSYVPMPGETSIDQVISAAADRAPEAVAARIRIEGAFNVNSLSKTAWKAVLSTLGKSELPVVDRTNQQLSWETPDGIRFNRFGNVILNSPYKTSADGGSPEFWQGWRDISATELDQLAEAMVQQVRERGPFRTMADFVNRNPNGTAAQQKKGAIQAAIDSVANASLPASVGKPAGKPPGAMFSDAASGENQAAGSAAYLLQGDVLTSLAPVMQVRSDYFRIRTCGEAHDASGRVTATAWCEAFVQRQPDYVESVDAVFQKPDELVSQANRKFGRRFAMVSFRWLSKSEI